MTPSRGRSRDSDAGGGDTHPTPPSPSPPPPNTLHQLGAGPLTRSPQRDAPLRVFFAVAGWDVEGDSSGGISPDVLVSLAAPKECARRFLGRQHFVAGRFLPYDVQKKFELNPPEYPGTECVVALRAPRQ